MVGGPQWEELSVPGFSDVSQILRNAAASWQDGMGGLGETLGNAANNQRRVRSNAILPQLGQVANEGDVNGFLNDLPNLINANDMTPELTAAVAALRGTAQGYEQNRADINNTQAGTAGLMGGERRQQGLYDRQLSEDQGLIELSRYLGQAGIAAFNRDGIAVDQQGQPVMDRNGQPVTQQAAMASAQAALPTGALPNDPQARGMVGAATDLTRRQLYRDGIARIESDGSGGYSAIGATHPEMGRALGRYQIMESNLPQWSREALGRVVTAEEFIRNPEIQDAIFDYKFGGYVAQYGEEGAAQAWFGGPGGVGRTNRTDVHGRLNIGQYGQNFVNNIGGNGGSIPPQIRARIDGPMVDPNFDFSMGGRVRATTLQPLLNGVMDQATAGANESRTARNDQQDYMDNIQQFQQDQITFQQSQADRATSQALLNASAADRLAAEAAVNDVMDNQRPTSIAEAARLLARTDLTVDQMALAQPMLGTLATEAYFSQESDLTAPIVTDVNNTAATYGTVSDNVTYADSVTRVNDRVAQMASDTNPVLFLRESLPGLDMTDGEVGNAIQETISNAARGPGGVTITPAQASAILAEALYTQTFGQSVIGLNMLRDRDWGDSLVDPELAGEMAQSHFSREAQRMSAERIAEADNRKAGINAIQSRLDEVTSRIAIEADLGYNPSQELLTAQREFQNQLNNYERDNPIPSTDTADNGRTFDADGSVTTTPTRDENGRETSRGLFQDSAERIVMGEAEQFMEKEFPIFAGRIENASPELRNEMIRLMTERANSSTNLSAEEKQRLLDGFSLLTQRWGYRERQ